MRKLVVGAFVGLMLVVPCAASAQLYFGARLGYSAAGGDVYKDFAVSNNHTGMLPVQVDLGFDIEKALALGVYASAGYTMLSKDVVDFCDAFSLDCTGLNVRVGAEATLHATVGQSSKIWGGALLGWEQQQYKMSSGSDSITVAYRGVEVGLEGGFDFPTASSLRWGPFVSASVGEYQSASLEVTGIPPGGLEPITDKAQHTWLTFGLRGVFGL